MNRINTAIKAAVVRWESKTHDFVLPSGDVLRVQYTGHTTRMENIHDAKRNVPDAGVAL